MAIAGKRDRCGECGERFPRPGQLSKQGYCAPCGLRRATESARQMAAKSGPYYDRWLVKMREALGA